MDVIRPSIDHWRENASLIFIRRKRFYQKYWRVTVTWDTGGKNRYGINDQDCMDVIREFIASDKLQLSWIDTNLFDYYVFTQISKM